MFCKAPLSEEWVRDTIQELWLQIRLHIKDYKEVCDSLTHSEIEIVEENSNHIYFRRVLNEFSKVFGLMSLQVQSLMKMAVEVELSSKTVRDAYKNNADLYAPAFLPGLVARPDLSTRLGRSVNTFFEDGWRCLIDDETWRKRHPNLERMIRLLRKHFDKYMSKLVPKIYVLTNASATRFEDGVNICDINGIAYITEEESEAVKNRWDKIISFFKMLNFDDDLTYVSTGSSDYYGTINVAPDDSGKTRISYCIDPVVQVISKAVAKCLDYVSRKFPSNCTKDQMRIVRKIIKERWNEYAFILSLDMSKYSDTLQFLWIEKVLSVMGFPSEVIIQIRDLYTLPMYDKVKERITPRTTASYQGQYGDFSMITLINIWTQCNIYDYLQEYYELELEHKINGGAVGDDTIMVFLRKHDNLFEVARQFYAHLGVNINRTKTHTLYQGEGTADFIKRFITKDGLVPYLRLAPFFTPDRGQWIEEILRFQRSNEMVGVFNELCDFLLSGEESRFCKNLHVLNGGAVDRQVTEDDIKLFCYRDERLSFKYSPRNKDELRHWIDLMHSRDVELCKTALIGFCPHYEEMFEDVIGDDEENYWTVTNYQNMEKATVDGILSCYTHGFEHATLNNLQDLIGLTMSQLKSLRPDLIDYLDDYNHDEAYRYLNSQEKRVRRITVYQEMMEFNSDAYELPQETHRSQRVTDYSAEGVAHNRALGSQMYELFSSHCRDHGWYFDYDECWRCDYRPFVTRQGVEKRLYKLQRETSMSRSVLSYEEFYQVMRPFLGEREDSKDMYYLFLDSMPYLNYSD